MNDAQDKILFQFTMNPHAYRREAIAVRALATVLIAGAACGLCALSIMLGVAIAAAVVAVGTITVVVAFADARSYTVYASRIVLKRRNAQHKTSVPIESITAVRSTRAFYQKEFDVDTVTVTARTKNGVKKYRLKHILNSAPAVEFLKSAVEKNNARSDK